jgi:hypothetical protein
MNNELFCQSDTVTNVVSRPQEWHPTPLWSILLGSVPRPRKKKKGKKKVSYIVGWIKLVWFGALYRLGPRWALFLEFLSSRFSFEVFVFFSLWLNLFQFVSQKRQIWSPPSGGRSHILYKSLCNVFVHGISTYHEDPNHEHVHYNLPNITHVATKVHVILRRYVVLTWMHDNRELV